jgi:predicted HNH restriction endonuclease
MPPLTLKVKVDKICGYKSQRQRGDVNDLEVHHIDPVGGNGTDNLQTVCLNCHQRLKAIKQG